jgi:hypothetical protein
MLLAASNAQGVQDLVGASCDPGARVK